MIILVALFQLISLANARTRCVRVKGKLNCATDQTKTQNIEVTLYDEDDLLWETDDLMGRNASDGNGEFVVEGCGYDFDFFYWNDPEPFIVISHECHSALPQYLLQQSLTKQIRIPLDQTFLPNELDIGEIRLDLTN
ncbi:unnamed protein product [Anisakis simplex]|uniref:Transthyretin-like protein 52 (inferred by orthology to a C. elegans protein) n=1 Tax=Anisakis simplex TaxID=6269 RepID=A0A0M3JX81_ANISI|nr:unnamed protein product [Anisakis simplex]